MAPEIADSDGESDVMDNRTADVHLNDPPTPGNDDALATEQVSPPQIDFDDFIDPTQAFSEQSPVQNGVPGPGTGSTEKMLRGLANAQHRIADSSLDKQTGFTNRSDNTNNKRRHSASEGVPSALDEVPGKKKRVKTYGSKSRSGSTIDLYAGANAEATQHVSSLFATGSEDSENVQGTVDAEVRVTTRERDRPRRVISLLGQHMNASRHQLSTTTSSFGGYQSVELDFRGGSNGLDINANPFAGLSQPSVNGDDQASLQGDVQHEMMTSPEHNHEGSATDSIDPTMLMQLDPVEAVPSLERSSMRCKTDNAARAITASPAPSTRRAVSVSTESVSNMSDKSQPKKRGRKPKSSRLAHSSQQEAMAPPEMPEAPPSKRTRRGTLESSQASHDETPSNTKRKRKQSKSEAKQLEVTPTKNPSSELHLDDEKVIGLPKENYKPRPSRRRSRQVKENEETPKAAADAEHHLSEAPEDDSAQPRTQDEPQTRPLDTSPAKRPTSELHLDDEQVIGLPKENYKPRPSRRRSRAVADEDRAEADWTGPLTEMSDDLLAEQKPASITTPEGKDNKADAAPEDPPPTPPKAAKSIKKSKVKRAKTSAAALLRKSSRMLSDGEDDVLWLDSKPAAVKLDLPPDLKALKKEEDTKVEAEPEAATSKRKSKISVEIPLAASSKALKEPEPGAGKKKRGRPKKSTQNGPPSGLPPGSPALDRAPTPEPISDAEGTGAAEDEEDEDEDEIKTSTRPRNPLAAKAPNALPAPPVSPAKLPTDNTRAGKENVPPQITPAKPSNVTTKDKTTTTPSPTKGPTSHSPINPNSAWNSKSRYRVGLSKRQSIPSLLRRVDKDKAAPTKVSFKVKERKIKNANGNEDVDGEDGEAGGGGKGDGALRDKDGNLVEWEF